MNPPKSVSSGTRGLVDEGLVLPTIQLRLVKEFWIFSLLTSPPSGAVEVVLKLTWAHLEVMLA